MFVNRSSQHFVEFQDDALRAMDPAGPTAESVQVWITCMSSFLAFVCMRTQSLLSSTQDAIGHHIDGICQ
jgi:hypothetical protein